MNLDDDCKYLYHVNKNYSCVVILDALEQKVTTLTSKYNDFNTDKHPKYLQSR